MMGVEKRPLLVLHSHDGLERHLRIVARREYEVRQVATWSALRAEVRDASPVAVVIVDPYSESEGRGPAQALRSFLQDFSYVPVVGAMPTRANFRDLLILARWGLSEVISLDEEILPLALRERLRGLDGWTLRSALERSAPPELSGPALALLLQAADVVMANGNTVDLASRLGISRRTVTRWCRRADLPPPRRLLAWMRLLLASEFLDDWKRKVYRIAHACGYSSDNALRTALEAFLDLTPKELRRVGAFATVSQAFWAELGTIRRTRRAAAPSPAPPGVQASRLRNGSSIGPR
jgi:AraC-like DNA-binding protein